MIPLKRIKSVSARKISKRVNILARLDLCILTKDFIAKNLLNSFKIPYNQFPQQANKGFIFRACINESELPFSSIKRIAYNPNPVNIGRANLIGKGIGYGANSLDIAAIESCQDSLRESEQSTFFLTIGKWIINESLRTALICHSEKALLSGTDLNIAFNALTNLMIKENNYRKKQLRIWNLKNKFFADQFAKSMIRCKNEYLFSAIYANTVFKSKNPKIDCIWYPSQAYKYKGFNIAYKPELVDQKTFTVVEVSYAKIEFLENRLAYPTITILKSTGQFAGDKIIW